MSNSVQTKTNSTSGGILDALAEAHALYTEANPKSLARFTVARTAMPGGNTRSVLHYAPFPLAFASAEGAALTSVDGGRYTDFLGEYTAGLYGHSNPTIMKAIEGALENGISYGGHNVMEARLAELMCERFPSLELVRFTNTGTESNIMAIATAVAATERSTIVVFQGAYHGGVLSFQGANPLNLPYDFIVASYNDVERTAALLRELADTVAAVLIEPMLGSGGCIPATMDFLTMLREETRRIGAVLIFDEVMTSRLSRGGLQGLRGVLPDLTTFGKYLGGGMSFGAFGGNHALMDHFDPSRPGAWQHPGTFNNNVLSMAAGVAGLEEVLTEAELERLNARGDRLRNELNVAFEAGDIAMQATGIGSVLNIHATADPLVNVGDLAADDKAVKELLFFDLVADGFWLARRGMIALSIAVTDEDCERFMDAIRLFLQRRGAILPRR